MYGVFRWTIMCDNVINKEKGRIREGAWTYSHIHFENVFSKVRNDKVLTFIELHIK